MNLKKLKWLKFLVAFLVAIAGVMVCNQELDNDSWYVLAEGREIVENGLYYEDQLSMHEGLEVTVQNYGFAVIYYLLYSAFGGVGIYLAMLCLNGLLIFLIYKICMLLSGKNENLSLFLAVATDLLLAYGFVVTRAQMVDYVAIMGVIYLLELYARKGKEKLLWWLPVVSLLMINLHASTWLMLVVIMVVYIIDGIKQPRFHYKGYKVKPLLLALLGVILAGFLNPYGIKMMTFILTSYGSTDASKYIKELNSFSFGDVFDILLYFVITLTMILYIFGKKRNIRLRYLILTFGFLALGLNTVKGMSELILVLLFPMAEVYKDVRIKKKLTFGIKMAILGWTGMLSMAITTTCAIFAIPNLTREGPNEIMITAMNVLDENLGGVDKKTLKVYADYNEGGFVEYRGYRAYIDPRMEVFLESNNQKEDIFLEYYDLQNGKMNKQEFLDKYDFDYLIVRGYDALYGVVEEGYEIIYEQDDGMSSEVRIYKKLKNNENGVKI